MSRTLFRVNVRAVAEFYFESGDLESGRGPVQRMLEGMKGHRLLQSSYRDGWQSEVAIRSEICRAGLTIVLQGRIDGLLLTPDRACVEEIKTVCEDVSRMAGDGYPVHWAQAELYAWMLAGRENRDTVEVRLVYLNLNGGRTAFTRVYSRQRLDELLDRYLTPYLDWMKRLSAWHELSRPAMLGAVFPFGGYRAGQREMATNVYVALSGGKNLLCQAPTGIGKTAASLFPALKALGEDKIGRIFYLTARTTGRRAAEQALDIMRASGLKARGVTVTARDTICPLETRDCRPEACPRARGYYDRRRAALLEAMGIERLDRPAIEALAQKHTLCPFELSLDLAETADVVLCDYNYVFDPRVKLQRFFTGRSDAGLLIDEAHNLCDRTRDMLSGRLNQRDFALLRRNVGKAAGRRHPLYSALTALLNEMKALRASLDGAKACMDRPEALIDAAAAFSGRAEEYLSESRFDGLADRFFETLDFLRAADGYDGHYRTLIEPDGKTACCVTLWCADPSAHIAQTLKRVHGAALFSATLSPMDFYRDLLGLSAENGDALLDLPSPFPPENLLVMRAALPLRYKQRQSSLPALCALLSDFVSGAKGNYLLCFPSYAFMRQTIDALDWDGRSVRLLVQSSDMSEEDRQAFLDSIETAPEKTTAIFIVMGGVFSEGIDLSGNRLSGAAIVGTGVPQLSLRGDTLRAIYEARYGRGYAYAYLYPGLTRVFQAAGRIIRSETDRGALLLIDERWSEAGHAALCPAHWRIQGVRCAGVRATMEKFWKREM